MRQAVKFVLCYGPDPVLLFPGYTNAVTFLLAHIGAQKLALFIQIAGLFRIPI